MASRACEVAVVEVLAQGRPLRRRCGGAARRVVHHLALLDVLADLAAAAVRCGGQDSVGQLTEEIGVAHAERAATGSCG